MKTDLSVLLQCIVVSALMTGSAAAEDKTEWRYFSYFPPNDAAVKLTREFAADLLAATNGRLDLQVFAAGELPYTASDVFKAVATNQVQMGDVAIGSAAGDAPELDVISLPFLCTSFDGFRAAVTEIGPLVNQLTTERFGVVTVMNWTMPSQNFWFNKPVQNSEEISGLKIRTWNPEQVKMVQAMGGSPVSITSAEVIPALERKVIDGAITSALSANEWRAYELVETGFMASFALGHQVSLVNQAALEALPEDVRAIFETKVKEWQPRYTDMTEQGETAAKTNLADNGVNLVTPSEEDFARMRELMLPMWSAWADANGALGAQMLEIARTRCAS